VQRRHKTDPVPDENESNRLLREIRDILSEYKADAAEAKARMDARGMRGQSINYMNVVVGVFSTWIGIDLAIHPRNMLQMGEGVIIAVAGLLMAFQLRWPWRFSVRSLFIVTTLLAVVLGMIAWLDRAWIGK
jgi:hypothetical protein